MSQYKGVAITVSLFRSSVAAICDAIRAWKIVPQFHRRPGSVSGKAKSLQFISRSYSLRELLAYKFRVAGSVFRASLPLRLARNVWVPGFASEGLLANLLHALEVLHRVRPDAVVHIDWVLRGSETGFRYGIPGECVWEKLFAPLDPQTSSGAFCADSLLEYAFWGTGKDYLHGTSLQRLRTAYNRTFRERIQVTNKRVLEEIRALNDSVMDGRFCIGIHRRVPNILVGNLQRDGKVPGATSFIKAAQSMALSSDRSDWAVYLATDDADAVPLMREAFGSRLIVRDHVRRTRCTQVEVHYAAWGTVHLADAEDVLIDTLILSQCNVVLHASSSVTTAVGIINPALLMVRVVE
jgi:hypothetical protein